MGRGRGNWWAVARSGTLCNSRAARTVVAELVEELVQTNYPYSTDYPIVYYYQYRLPLRVLHIQYYIIQYHRIDYRTKSFPHDLGGDLSGDRLDSAPAPLLGLVCNRSLD